jgi:predicted nuclease with TOPRIM domain
MTENSSYEACWAELQELKKKYDQVREYTVHLTAERDSVLSKLERLQKEMKLEGEGDRTKDKATSRFALKETARGIAVSDYSLFMVLFAAVVAFLAGYFVST